MDAEVLAPTFLRLSVQLDFVADGARSSENLCDVKIASYAESPFGATLPSSADLVGATWREAIRSRVPGSGFVLSNISPCADEALVIHQRRRNCRLIVIMRHRPAIHSILDSPTKQHKSGDIPVTLALTRQDLTFWLSTIDLNVPKKV